MTSDLHPATDANTPLISIDDHAPVDLSGHNAPEDWLALGLFWLMCTVVFLQFFTRYVLNDSFAWTEEIARYVLIAVIYVGTAMCVRRNRHIHVDFIYRLIPAFAGRILSTFVDVLRIGFFAYGSWIMWKLMAIIGSAAPASIRISVRFDHTCAPRRPPSSRFDGPRVHPTAAGLCCCGQRWREG